MGALTKARPASVRTVTRDLRPLAADAVVYKGGLAIAVISSTGKGYYKQGDATSIGVAVGRFYADADNDGGADGDVSVEIHFFRERSLFLLNNDTVSACAVTDRESVCYVKDDQTVTAAVNNVEAGLVYDVTTEGVWVEVDGAGLPGVDGTVSHAAPTDPSSSAASGGVSASASALDHKHHIPVAIPAAEGLMSGAQAGTIHAPVADLTALKAIAAADRAAGMLCMVLSDTAGEISLWRFHASSTAADTSENLVAAPAAGSGRWLRADKFVNLCLAADYTKADNATLFTVPVGARLRPLDAYWDITTTFAGGSSSAIGVHASPTGWATKGDILGGASGDLTATLVSTNTRKVGTKGAKQADGDFGLILVAADTLKFDRITSVYTSGAGNVRVPCELIVNPGA